MRNPRAVQTLSYGKDLDESIEAIAGKIKALNIERFTHIPPRFFAIKLLESDTCTMKIPELQPVWKEVSRQIKHLSDIHAIDDTPTFMADKRYAIISGACRGAISFPAQKRRDISDAIDTVVTNKFLGLPIFFAIMYATFWFTFTCADPVMGWIEEAFAALGDGIKSAWGSGTLPYIRDLLTDGIIGGVGGVVVFLPNILFMFLALALLEESGYMARAAFIMDGLMRRFGLQGKSFVPLILGFGCSVPAIMATRSIESERDRKTTIMVLPLMSCSARLPIYSLIIPAFFAEKYQAFTMWTIYILGIAVALLAALALKKTVFKGEGEVYLMELPPYRIPTAAATLRHMWDRSEQYLKKIGGVILIASIAVWFLSYFPRQDAQSAATGQEHYSYLDRLGRGIEPVLRPLGLDWKAAVALVAGVPAKEVVASTLGVLYNSEEEGGDNLSEKLLASGDFTQPSAVAFMIFIMLYCPCIATVSAISNESGSWKWGAFSVIYNTAAAWIVAWLGMLVTTWII